MQGSRDPSLDEMGTEDLENAEASSFWETLWMERSSNLEIILVGMVSELSIMIKAKVLQLRDHYMFLDNFHVHIPGFKNQVTLVYSTI